MLSLDRKRPTGSELQRIEPGSEVFRPHSNSVMTNVA